MVEAPVDDAGEGAFLQQIVRLQPPGVGLHAIAAGRHQDVLRAGAVHGYAAVHARLLQRDELAVIVHDHGQGGCAAFQRLHLHHHGDTRHALFDGLGRFFLAEHALTPSLLQQQGDRLQVFGDHLARVIAVRQVDRHRHLDHQIARLQISGQQQAA